MWLGGWLEGDFLADELLDLPGPSANGRCDPCWNEAVVTQLAPQSGRWLGSAHGCRSIIELCQQMHRPGLRFLAVPGGLAGGFRRD